MNKTFSVSLAALCLFACIIFFSKCQKEFSYEGGVPYGGSAVYTLAGAGGDCTGSTISGNYYIGTALTSTNSIQLQVDVTTVGTYTLSTNSTNGILFSGSGTFINTGVQTITLTGAGTPTSAGSFVFTALVGSGCSFTVEVSASQASFTLAGAPDACNNIVVMGQYTAGSALSNANYVQVNVNVTVVGPYTISTDTLDGISFSATGTFTATGNTTVTLMGSGTPDVPENLIFTPSGGGSNCTFKIAVVNPDPLATYVLESGFGNPSPCIYTLAGTYTSNTPLSASNTVSMHVFVTVVGNFTVSATTINGMTFSLTGTFTTLGAQSIVLTGTGTPATSGTFTFLPEIVGPAPLGGAACAFDVTVL